MGFYNFLTTSTSGNKMYFKRAGRGYILRMRTIQHVTWRHYHWCRATAPQGLRNWTGWWCSPAVQTTSQEGSSCQNVPRPSATAANGSCLRVTAVFDSCLRVIAVLDSCLRVTAVFDSCCPPAERNCAVPCLSRAGCCITEAPLIGTFHCEIRGEEGGGRCVFPSLIR